MISYRVVFDIITPKQCFSNCTPRRPREVIPGAPLGASGSEGGAKGAIDPPPKPEKKQIFIKHKRRKTQTNEPDFYNKRTKFI